jgi:pimeloyl-ACP methyl ester carboxylesterase
MEKPAATEKEHLHVLPAHSQPIQQRILMREPDIQLCVDVVGNPAHPVVIWLADPLALQPKECWSRQFTGPLTASCYLVRYDLRGLGCSSKPGQSDAYSLRAQARDLQAIIGSFGNARVAVVAAGWAGAILAEYLRQFVPAHTLVGLVLVGAITHVNRHWRSLAYEAVEYRSRWLTAQDDGIRRNALEEYPGYGYLPAQLPQEHWQHMVESALAVPQQAMQSLFNAYRAAVQLDAPAEKIALCSVPILICHGEDDRLVSMKEANIASTQFPTGRVIHYPRLGHALIDEERPSQDIQTFLEEVAS